MTRIIAGSAGGRTLLTPSGSTTRPTSDRVREAVFSSLETLVDLPGAAVLDLYAGSGALGLEAASRGATGVTCVESDRGAARLIARNARAMALPAVDVVCDRVERWLRRGSAGASVDLVLADPPYRMSEQEVATMLALLSPRLRPGALLVLERSARSPDPPWPRGWEVERSRRYGQTSVHLAWPTSAEPL